MMHHIMHTCNEDELQVDKTSLTCIWPFEGVILEAQEFLVCELENKSLYYPIFMQDYSPENLFE